MTARLLRTAVATAALLAALPGAATGGLTPAGPGTRGEWLPQHPFMSSSGANTMHGDGYSSDTHPFPGPAGRDPQVRIAYKSPCAGMTFTRAGLMVLQCGGVQNFTLRLVDPATMRDLATYALPPRPSTIRAAVTADMDAIYSDSSGAYFYLDEQDRAVVADAAAHVQRIVHERLPDGTWRMRATDDWDLSGHLPRDCESPANPRPSGECDVLTAVLPDWDGLLWWVTRLGRIGTLDPATGAVRVLHLPGEEIQNSHSVSEDGVGVVSDHALYLLRAGDDGTPRIVWRETYDRGTSRKYGQINQGSGTTPTFLGRRYVAIADNADDRINVLVYRRADEVRGRRLVCSVPVFAPGASATENSLVGWGRSLVVENNHGYRDPRPILGRTTPAGGLTRIDVDEDGRGCTVVWHTDIRSPSVVPKLARGNGLLFGYGNEVVAPGVDDWYLVAIDMATGRTAYRVRVGSGPPHDNAWAPITIGPGGTAWVSLFGGIAAVRDALRPDGNRRGRTGVAAS